MFESVSETGHFYEGLALVRERGGINRRHSSDPGLPTRCDAHPQAALGPLVAHPLASHCTGISSADGWGGPMAINAAAGCFSLHALPFSRPPFVQ